MSGLENPYASPTFHSGAQPGSSDDVVASAAIKGDPNEIYELGVAQRRLRVAMLLWFLPLLFLFAMLATVPFQMYSVFCVARALRLGIALSVGAAVLSLFPLLNIIPMLIFSVWSTGALRKAGISSGLLGACNLPGE